MSDDGVRRGLVFEPRHAIWLGIVGLALAHAPLLAYDPGNQELPHLEDVLFEPTSAASLPVILC